MASYIFLEDGVSKLLLENGDDYLLEQEVPAVTLSLSDNIAASAATDTTAQLTAPSGKTSGSDFQAGKISDDTNPITTDLASGKYTELEWSLKLSSLLDVGDEIEFRITNSGTVIDTYSQTAKITIGVAGSVVIPIFMKIYRTYKL